MMKLKKTVDIVNPPQFEDDSNFFKNRKFFPISDHNTMDQGY